MQTISLSTQLIFLPPSETFKCEPKHCVKQNRIQRIHNFSFSSSQIAPNQINYRQFKQIQVHLISGRFF